MWHKGVITSSQALDGIEAGAEAFSFTYLQMNLVKLSSGHKIPLMLTATTPNKSLHGLEKQGFQL